jgi:hypothetical protein
MYRINGVSANTNSCGKSKNCKVRCGSHLMRGIANAKQAVRAWFLCDERPQVKCALVCRLLELNVAGPQSMLKFEVCASFFVEPVASDLRTIDDATHFRAALLSASAPAC